MKHGSVSTYPLPDIACLGPFVCFSDDRGVRPHNVTPASLQRLSMLINNLPANTGWLRANRCAGYTYLFQPITKQETTQ